MIKLILIALLSASAFSQNAKINYANPNEFFKDKTKIKNPFGLRDPFKAPFRKKKEKKELKKGVVRDGIFTNLPTIKGAAIDRIKIRGIFIGKDRRAMAQIEGAPGTHVIREGMKLGKDNAVVKAILPGGIVLVEKITNVYGQDEYLETILPISQ